ncbi:hypothetical protein EG328_003928 [Venturia inaequalis]|uniref:Uncharacterized protein n=2 Tax=Venturia inaequalis TaxID=5025 RepID=A0A8H3UT80_VENIN|nr:hypothetical protein EG328_003928 [Venturia inaequalis]KAE9992639.1 hypothetical protein EG327_008382 [Venturia inaequalis]
MRTPSLLAVVLAACRLGCVLGLGEAFGAEILGTIKPIPQAYDVASAIRANGTTIRDTECKNCPYGNCINYGWLSAGLTAPFQCFTQGENIGNTKTWLRYAIGTRQDEFCYVSTFDMQPGKGDFTVDLPYCGTKSELSFYLPNQKVKTLLYTECSLCPWRDCEGVKFYQSGATLDVNCQINDGWKQLGPLHPEGTRKYYRTLDNCYVSVNTVEDLAQKAPASNPTTARPAAPMQEYLPYCGPVPHLKAVDRPGLTEDSPPLPPLAKPAISPPSATAPVPPPAQKPQPPPKPANQKPQDPPQPAQQRPQFSPKTFMPKSVAAAHPLQGSTPAVVPEDEDEEEESGDEEEAPTQFMGHGFFGG